MNVVINLKNKNTQCAYSVKVFVGSGVVFVYLNKLGFGGIIKYNLNGDFNVSYVYYNKSHFLETGMQVFINKINAPDLVELSAADFRIVLCKF